MRPPGTKGISLFLIPKFLRQRRRLARRAQRRARAVGIEHKLGIHGSPTCTMVYGDHGGADRLSDRRGKPRHGLHVHDDEPAPASASASRASASPSAPLSRRSPMRRSAARAARPAAPAASRARSSCIPTCGACCCTMRALTARRARHLLRHGGRARPRRARRPATRRAQAAHARAALLTPIAKAFSTDIGIEVASLGVQVHGGMGFIEETGAAQHYRDARIAPIYEGTNGIQAIDLVTRKLPLAQGRTVRAYLNEIARTIDAVDRVNDAGFGWMGVRLRDALECLERTTHWLLARAHNDRDAALAGATPYLRLFALTAGGALLAEEALAARRLSAGVQGVDASSGVNGTDAAGRIAIARFFAENFAVHAGALERTITEGADTITAPSAALE